MAECDEIRPECLAKLDAMHADILVLKKAVVEGNGSKGLIRTVEGHSMALKIIGAGMLAIVPVIVGIILVMALSGCVSSTQRLASRLADVQEAVVSARQSVQAARTAVARVIGAEDTPASVKTALRPVVGHLGDADGHMGDVGEAATGAQQAAAGVKDKENELLALAKLAAMVALMVGGLIVLAKLGVFAVVKPIMRRIGSKISGTARAPPE